jgi:hypothetical protein
MRRGGALSDGVVLIQFSVVREDKPRTYQTGSRYVDFSTVDY